MSLIRTHGLIEKLNITAKATELCNNITWYLEGVDSPLFVANRWLTKLDRK